jgi:HSP20 family protein
MHTKYATSNGRAKHKAHRRPNNSIFFPAFGNIVNELMNSPLSEVLNEEETKYTVPAANIQDKEDAYIIELSVPGYTKKEIDITVEKKVLSIVGHKEEAEGINFRKREFNYNKFKRSFTLPEKANIEAIKANFSKGILSITIAKKEEEPVRKISIK